MNNECRKMGIGAVLVLFLATGWARADQPMPSDYELARWAFNEGSGTNTADLSGHGWTVTMLQDNGVGVVPTATNTLWTSDTPSGTGNALALNGADQYASPEPFSGGGNVLWTLSTLTNWSMCLWVKVQAPPGKGGTLLGHWDGWGNVGWTFDDLKYGPPGADNLVFSGVVEGTPNPPAVGPPAGRQGDQVLGPCYNMTGVWHHVVLTWRQDAATANTFAKYYLDGIDNPDMKTLTMYTSTWFVWPYPWTENGPMPTGTFDADTWHPLLIGAYGRNDTQTRGSFFQGLVDEVRVFSEALTTNEVKQLYLQPELSAEDLWRVEHPLRGTVILVN